MVRRNGLEHPIVNCGLPGDRVCEVLEVCLEDLPRVLGEDCVFLAQGEHGRDCVSRYCVSFDFNTMPLQTRCTTVTTVGTGSSTTVFTEKRVLIPQLLTFLVLCVDDFHCDCLKNLLKTFSEFPQPQILHVS